MAKKCTLPEITVNTGGIVEDAKKAMQARAKVAEHQKQEDDAKSSITESALFIRVEQEARQNYIGKIVITAEDFPPVRCEFRTDKAKAALDVTQEKELDRMFGPARPLLFSKEVVVTAITDPNALIAQLKKEGKNPWDYLSIGVKKGMDGIIAQTKECVISKEGLIPQEGYLNILNDIQKGLSEEAKTFIHEYLKSVLNPTVVLGTKGKE